MITYFIRRLACGVATFLAATFVLYTAIVLPGASINPNSNEECLHCSRLPYYFAAVGAYSIYKLDRPWPSNYLTWLYDPNGDVPQTFTLPEEHLGRWGILPERTAQFTSLGLLRGDFGQSLRVQPRTPALAAYGIDLLPWAAFMGTLLFGSMAVAYLQRRNRVGSVKAQRVWL